MEQSKSGGKGRVGLILAGVLGVVVTIGGCCFLAVLGLLVLDGEEEEQVTAAAAASTEIPFPSATATPAPSVIQAVEATPTETEAPPTETPEPTATEAAPTETPEPTATEAAPTETPEPTPTETILPIPAETPTDLPTATPAGPIIIIVEVDKKAEYVDIKNIGGERQDLNGWRLLSEKGNQDCSLAGVLEAGQTLRIWAQAGDGDGGGFNCGYNTNIWNNSERDPAVLYDAGDIEIDRK